MEYNECCHTTCPKWTDSPPEKLDDTIYCSVAAKICPFPSTSLIFDNRSERRMADNNLKYYNKYEFPKLRTYYLMDMGECKPSPSSISLPML